MIYELYILIFIIGVVSIFYTFLYRDADNFTHIITGFLSAILFFILGYNMYIGVNIDYVVLTKSYTNGSITNLTSEISTQSYQYDWLGLLFILIGAIMALYSIVQIIHETSSVISILEHKENER